MMDWDQRRVISVSMDAEIEDPQVASEHLRKYADNLYSNIYKIQVSSQGDLMSVSTDPEDDQTQCPFYSRLATIQRPDGIQVISRSDMEEIGRLGPMVDKVRFFKMPEPNKVSKLCPKGLAPLIVGQKPD